jgi:hypothetical protein
MVVSAHEFPVPTLRTVTARANADVAWSGLVAMVSSAGFTMHPPDNINRRLIFYYPVAEGPWQCDVIASIAGLPGDMSVITLSANDGATANIPKRAEAAVIKSVASRLDETFGLVDKAVLREEAPIEFSAPATEVTRPAVIIGAVVLLLLLLFGFSW